MEIESRHRRVMVVVGLGISCAVAAVVLVVGRDAGPSRRAPAPVVDAAVTDANRVEVRIDRCESDPVVTETSLAGNRLVLEVTAEEGSSAGCRDLVEVATVTDDILVLQDATSGTLFILRSAPTEPSARTPGTRE